MPHAALHALLISSSNVAGYGFLDQPEPFLRELLGDRPRVHFLPFAAADHDAYTAFVAERLGRMGYDVAPIRDAADLRDAEAIFAGGGNTWRLLKTLYERALLAPIRDAAAGGVPYIGSSAGSNIAAPTIRTTNDMPIVEVPSMNALALVPFQINPHYLDPDPASTHRGETREERLRQYLEENERPVIALREGSALRVIGSAATLLGDQTARIFIRGREPFELAPGPFVLDELSAPRRGD
jgi:dipeptidase E